MSFISLAAVLAAAASLGLAASPTAGAGEPSNDALSAARFSISVDGIDLGRFSKADGLTTTFEAPRTVVLARGTGTSLGLFAWHQTVVSGQLSAARNAALVMYGASGQPVARYHLENAWPSKVEVGALRSGASEVPYESVTIVAERIQRVSP